MKKIQIIRTSLLCLSFVVSNLVWSQTDNASSDWQLMHEANGVQIFAKQESCAYPHQDQKPCDYAFLKIVNTTNQEKSVSYNFGLEYTEDCSGCYDGSEFSYTLTVAANSAIEEDCSFTTNGLSRIIRNPNLEGGWNFEEISILNPQID